MTVFSSLRSRILRAGTGTAAVTLAGVWMVSAASALADFGDENWAEGFHVRGIEGTTSAFLEREDGLYIGGNFGTAGPIEARCIVRYAGGSFAPLGAGCNGDVEALVVFDGDLIACGAFSHIDGVAAAAWPRGTVKPCAA